MKKNYLLIICVVLSLNIFASCKKDNSVKDGLSTNTERAKESTLIEEPIPFPTSFEPNENPFRINVLPNEAPNIYTYQLEDRKTGTMLFKNYQWISDNWEEVQLNWTETIKKEKMTGLAWPIKGKDGLDYLLKFTQPASNRQGRNNRTRARNEEALDDLECQLYRVESNGGVTEVIDQSILKTEDEKDIPQYTEFIVLEDSTLLVKYNSGKLFRFDLSKKEKINEYVNVTTLDFTVQGTNLLCMNPDKDKLFIIDISTGDLLREIPLNIPEIENSTKFCIDEDDIIYIAATSGIYRLDSEEPTLLFSSERATIFGLHDKKDVLIEGISKVSDKIYVYYSAHKEDSGFLSTYDKDNNKLYQYSAN